MSAPGIAASDGAAARFPVSVKAVIRLAEGIVLLKNPRDEWELPGGKLDPGESPEECVAREVREELGLEVTSLALLDTWLYDIQGRVEVLIVTFGCQVREPDASAIRLSDEHREWMCAAPEAVGELRMPDGYKRSIARFANTGR